jgi:hypothetical protein
MFLITTASRVAGPSRATGKGCAHSRAAVEWKDADAERRVVRRDAPAMKDMAATGDDRNLPQAG